MTQQTADTTDFWHFCPRQLVTDLLRIFCAEATGKWCNGFWENLLQEVADLLQTCYGETVVTDFGLNVAKHVSDTLYCIVRMFVV